MRLHRKLEHIELSLKQKGSHLQTGFEDVTLVHNPLPELNGDEIDLSCNFLGKQLKAPLLINAMTGGHPQLERINYSLAKAAQVAGVAMAVGSQRAALEDASTRASFTVVREANPEGVILANLGAGCSLAEARAAIDMIKADGLQLHLNVPQELAMAEGDRNFKGILPNIQQLIKELEVPVVVKEVGFGMPRECIRLLAGVGVKYIDVGGAGGTDFMAIEQRRAGSDNNWSWGIPTATSLLEGISDDCGEQQLIASGGIRHALDCIKALSLGACLAGMARPLLRVLVDDSETALMNHLAKLIEDMKRIMLMLGARDVSELAAVPAIISGDTYHWLNQRGIEVSSYARRKK